MEEETDFNDEEKKEEIVTDLFTPGQLKNSAMRLQSLREAIAKRKAKIKK